MPGILILFAHPKFEKSRVHSRLIEAAQRVKNVTIHDLYERYPDFHIDVPYEQKALLRHDIILLQHPLYWYSCPPLLKQWLDLVLQHGWAYGKDGKALMGKKMGNVISSGGIQEAYEEGGFNRFTIGNFMAPFNQTARLCNMDYLPPYVIHGTHRANETDIAQEAQKYFSTLELLAEGKTDPDAMNALVYLNEIVR
jgi:glutathione-regulated potassium-efflux system ancillary protein KefG